MTKKQIEKYLHRVWSGLWGILVLTGMYYAGDWMAGFIPFPVPGSVVGMILVFALLQLRVLPVKWVESGAAWLLAFLGLFYVPYGVGVVESGSLIGEWGLQVVILIAVTVLVVFVFSGWVFRRLLTYTAAGDE